MPAERLISLAVSAIAILTAALVFSLCFPAGSLAGPCIGCPGDVFIYSETSMERYNSDSLVKMLEESEDPVIRRRAAVHLGARKEEGAIGALLDALDDENEYVRQAAAWAVCETDESVGATAFVSALEERDMPTVAGAYRFFIRIGVTGSEALLAECLEKYGDSEMARAFIGCGNIALKNAGVRWAAKKGMSVAAMSDRKGGPAWGEHR